MRAPAGEKRTTLFQRADRYEASVERLCWLLPPSPAGVAGRAGAARAGGGRSGPNTETGGGPTSGGPQGSGPCLLLSFGGDGLMRVWLVGATGAQR